MYLEALWAVVEENGNYQVKKMSDILRKARLEGPVKENLRLFLSYESAMQHYEELNIRTEK
jgi:hypothetical protein